LHGTEKWGVQQYRYTEEGGVQRFKIPVGTFYTGQMNYLFFVMDNDKANGPSESTFSNVLIYEDNDGEGGDPLEINFEQFDITEYGVNQNTIGFAEVLENGNSLRLDGNIWRKIPINITLSTTSVLEFEFRSTLEGQIHGIGFDNDNKVSSGRTFNLFGTQMWGNKSFTYTGNGEWQSFVIPIGEFYTGEFPWMIFAMDNDTPSPNSDSEFRNIVIR